MGIQQQSGALSQQGVTIERQTSSQGHTESTPLMSQPIPSVSSQQDTVVHRETHLSASHTLLTPIEPSFTPILTHAQPVNASGINQPLVQGSTVFPNEFELIHQSSDEGTQTLPTFYEPTPSSSSQPSTSSTPSPNTLYQTLQSINQQITHLSETFTKFQTQTETQLSNLTKDIEYLKTQAQIPPTPTPTPIINLSQIQATLDQILSQTSTTSQTTPILPQTTLANLNQTISNLLSNLQSLKPNPPTISVEIPQPLTIVPTLLKTILEEVQSLSVQGHKSHVTLLNHLANLKDILLTKPQFPTQTFTTPRPTPTPTYNPFNQPHKPTPAPAPTPKPTQPPKQPTPPPSPTPISSDSSPPVADDKKGENTSSSNTEEFTRKVDAAYESAAQNILQQQSTSIPSPQPLQERAAPATAPPPSKRPATAEGEQGKKKRYKTMARRPKSKRRKVAEGCSPIEPTGSASDSDDEDDAPIADFLRRRRRQDPASTPAPSVQSTPTIQTPSTSAPKDKGKAKMTTEQVEREESQRKESQRLAQEERELSQLAKALGVPVEEVFQAQEQAHAQEQERVQAQAAAKLKEAREKTQAELLKARSHKDSISTLLSLDLSVPYNLSQDRISNFRKRIDVIRRRIEPTPISRLSVHKGDGDPYMKMIRKNVHNSCEVVSYDRCQVYGFTEQIEILYLLYKSKSKLKVQFIQKIQAWIALAVSQNAFTKDDYYRHVCQVETLHTKGSRPFIPFEQREVHPDHTFFTDFEGLDTRVPLNITPELFKFISQPIEGIFFLDRAGTWRFFRQSEITKASKNFLFLVRVATRGRTGNENFEALVQTQCEVLAEADPLSQVFPEVKEEQWWED